MNSLPSHSPILETGKHSLQHMHGTETESAGETPVAVTKGAWWNWQTRWT